jgi:hypothetical protein
MNYKKLLEDHMHVSMDDVGTEEGQEVERLRLSDVIDGKYISDFIVVTREAYNIEKDDNGAVLAEIENGRMLVRVPNVKHYRIPDDVYRIDDFAFKDCTILEVVDVPYLINDYEIDKAMEHCDARPKLRMLDWPYDHRRDEAVEKEIAEGWTDPHGFVYSQDRKRLLKATDAKVYWIPEGVESIDRLAFVGSHIDELHIPYTCNFQDLPLDECPIFGSERVHGCFIEWYRPYCEKDFMEDACFISDDETIVADEHGVRYTADGKKLVGCKLHFNEDYYEVHEGVVTICSFAFGICQHYLVLSLPRSIRVIGDNIFGNEGGKIIIRNEDE